MTRIGRRKLLKSGAAAGVLAASGMALAAQPRQGGVLRAGLSGSAFDGAWDTRYRKGPFTVAAMQGAVFDCLTEVAADGALRGELAESWEASADARDWLIDLRRGVTFHNGKPFDAGDVIASFALHQQGSPASPILALIEDMHAESPARLRVRLRQGNPDFPYLLADPRLVIYPKGDMQRAMAEGIGTGLYRVTATRPGAYVMAERISGHYKGTTAGFVDAIEYRSMPVARDRAVAILENEVDVIDAPPAGFDAGFGVQVFSTASNWHCGFRMRLDHAPFDRPGIRKALRLSLDRAALAALWPGAEPGQDTPIGPMNTARTVAEQPISYDPVTARALLRDAGIDVLETELSVGAGAAEEAWAAAQLFVVSAREAGIYLTIVEDDSPAHPFRVLTSAGRATEGWALLSAYGKASPARPAGWYHSRFERVVEAARSELRFDRRRQLYRDAQAILRDDGPDVIGVFAPFRMAARAGLVVPARQGGLWPLDNGRMAERWWFA